MPKEQLCYGQAYFICVNVISSRCHRYVPIYAPYSHVLTTTPPPLQPYPSSNTQNTLPSPPPPLQLPHPSSPVSHKWKAVVAEARDYTSNSYAHLRHMYVPRSVDHHTVQTNTC
jgi:hypothetical protein